MKIIRKVLRLISWLWVITGIWPVKRVKNDVSLILGLSDSSYSELSGTAKKKYLNDKCRDIFYSHLLIISEVIRLADMTPHEVDSLVKIRCDKNLQMVLKRGKGALLVIPHFGNWEVLGAALAVKGYDIHSFYMDQSLKKLEAYLNRIRLFFGIKLIDRDDIRGAARALKKNALLGVIADQDGGPNGVYLRFMGRPVSAPRGAAALARMTGAGIVPTHIIRKPDNSFEIVFGKELNTDILYKLNRNKKLFEEQITRKIYEYYESLIVSCPEQWLWFYNRFKKRRHIKIVESPFPVLSYAFYNTLLFPVAVLVSPFVLYKSISSKEFFGFTQEHLGNPFPNIKVDKKELRILFHAVSVGESKVLFPLIKRVSDKLRARKVSYSLYISTTCVEARALIEKELVLKKLCKAVFYMPLDFRILQQRLYSNIKPHAVIISETDFWPNFFYLMQKKGVPVFLYNGRISKGIACFFNRARNLSRHMLSGFKRFYVQEEIDRKRLIYMAADPDRIIPTGNMKFCCTKRSETDQELKELQFFKGFFCLKKVIVCGSTHETDEIIISDLAIKKRDRIKEKILFVIAPRKVSRSASVAKRFKTLGFKTALYSEILKKETDKKNYEVIIIDKMGILSDLYYFSELAYIGGGFERTGVHSIIEPFMAGNLTCFGPNFKNFQTVAEKMIILKCGKIINNSTEFEVLMEAYLKNSSRRDKIKSICVNLIKRGNEKIETISEDIIESALKVIERKNRRKRN